MITSIPISQAFSGRTLAIKTMLACGILAPLLYIAMNIFIPMQWEEYNASSQTVSELSAIDAPTRYIWMPLGVLYAVLYSAFGSGVWKVAQGVRTLQYLGIVIFINGIISMFWPPMHQREVLAAGGATLTDTLHIIFSIATVFLFICSIVLGAIAFGRMFRIYSIITLILLLVFGILTMLDVPQMEADMPTPLMGVWERINIGVYMIWVIALAIKLLRSHGKKNKALTSTMS